MLRQKYTRKKKKAKLKNQTKKMYGGMYSRTRSSTGKRGRRKVKKRLARIHDSDMEEQNREKLHELLAENKLEQMLAAEGISAEGIPRSCSKKAQNSPVCRVCGWTKDPGALEKCKSCPGSPQSLEAAMDQIMETNVSPSESGQQTPEAIDCRHGDNRPKCRGKPGVKIKKASRRKCRDKGGKVKNKNSSGESCVYELNFHWN
mgnify:CR=1 FL=1